MADNNWYVVTGGPSTGKSTLLSALSALGHKTIPEAARIMIDEAAEKGIAVAELRADEKRFQYEVVQLKARTEAALEPRRLTFLDRGMHDTIAYLRSYGYATEEWIKKLAEQSNYKGVFLLEPLPVYTADYARTESDEFTKQLHELLYNAYAEQGMEPICVPPLSVQDRVDFVLNRMKS